MVRARAPSGTAGVEVAQLTTGTGPPAQLLVRGARLDGRSVDLLARDGLIDRISDAGLGHSCIGHAGGDSEAPGRVLDAEGLHLVPSFSNSHTHAAMTLFRGWGDDLPLDTWLRERIWPAEARMTADDVCHGTRLAIVEMIRSGTTHFNDMYWHAPAIARAAEELGVRAHVGAAFVDLGDGGVAARWWRAVDEWLEQREEWGTRIRATVAPHAIYTVSPDNLDRLGRRADRDDLLLHIHLSETEREVTDCVSAHGMRPTELLERHGLVTSRLVAAHGVHLDEAEFALLGRAGAAVVTNPAANLKLAVGGIFDHSAAEAAGVRVLLGTDGVASNNNLDLFEELKLVSLLQKHRAVDATALPAAAALDLATSAPGDIFGLGTGRIEEGAPADFLLLDLSGPATAPGHDLASDLVYAATGAVVHTTVCDGRVLMHDRVLEVADEEEIIESARSAARRLTTDV